MGKVPPTSSICFFCYLLNFKKHGSHPSQSTHPWPRAQASAMQVQERSKVESEETMYHYFCSARLTFLSPVGLGRHPKEFSWKELLHMCPLDCLIADSVLPGGKISSQSLWGVYFGRRGVEVLARSFACFEHFVPSWWHCLGDVIKPLKVAPGWRKWAAYWT